MARFENKVALVTGSGRGIGRAIAVRLASDGANIIVNDIRDNEDAEQTVQRIKDTGVEAHFIQADVSSVTDVYRLVEESVAQFGQLDILVNNAGIERKAPFWEMSEAQYDQVMNVNLKGAVFATQAFVKHVMKQQGSGVIINNSSVHEELPFPNFTAYCASKGGLQMMTRNLAVELAPHHIRINNVAPGAIKTEINEQLMDKPELMSALRENISMGHMGEPEDVAAVVAFLASDDAKYVTGSTYYVDGGLTWHYEEQ